MRVQIVVFDGVDELDAIAPLEVLQNATARGADFRVELVALEGTTEVTASHGVKLRPDGWLSRAARPDILIVPGGNWVSRAPQGVRTEVARGAIPELVKFFHDSGTVLASVCTGAMLIAATGLLKGRAAITHHGAVEDLRAAGADIVQARVVDDGEILSAGGVTSGLDLALWLVERFASPSIALQVERQMEYERRSVVWRRGHQPRGD